MRRTLIIAEAGVNHNGDIELGKKLIDAAKAAGADFVKFQTFKADRLVSKAAPKADYQKQLTGETESQHEMIRKLELSPSDHQTLNRHCEERGIQFLSTPFDEESMAYLVRDFHLPFIKIPSGELTNSPFLLAAARTGKPIVLSTGMATLKEIEQALSVIAFGYLGKSKTPSKSAFKKALSSTEGKKILKKRVTLLHCTTEYPCPFQDVNLAAMQTMKDTFDIPVGYSDHTSGIAISIAAAARGAVVIEKHFTLDRKMKGPDHQASLEPDELKSLVDGIRAVEQALGSGVKKPAPSEKKNIAIARKSLVAARAIKRGEVFTEENLTSKRPAGGVAPTEFWDWLGKKASRDYSQEEWIE